MPRRSKHSGKKLFVVGDKNPRRPGSLGFHSWNFVANNPGILYEDYIGSEYGRIDHLRSDLKNGYMKAVAPNENKLFPVNISNLILHIKYNGEKGSKRGTGFFISFEKKIYLITAKHIVYNMMDNVDDILYIWDGKWNPHHVKLFTHSVGIEPGHDFAVLKIQDKNLPFGNSGLSCGSLTKLICGTEVFVYGFPEGYIQEGHLYSGSITKNYPRPLIKRGIISGYAVDQMRNNIYTDIFTSPGFSGGPLIYFNDDEFNVIGIATMCSKGLLNGNTVYTGMGIFTPIECVINEIKKCENKLKPPVIPEIEPLDKIIG